MKKSSRLLALFLIVLMMFPSTFLNMSIAAAPNALWTTDVTNSQDANVLQYFNKLDVYVRIGESISGKYIIEVSDPGGATILGSSENFTEPRIYSFVNGQITSPEALGITIDGDNKSDGHDAYRLWDLVALNDATPGFSDTPNNGGSYKVSIIAIDKNPDKSDMFKVQNPISGNISIIKFNDSSENGVRDSDESLLSGISFELYKSDKLTLIESSTTVDGKINFDNLLPDTYYLKELSNYNITTPVFNEGFLQVIVSENKTTEILIGNYIPPDPDPVASIVIEKFNDASGDGVQQDGEEPLDGIAFVLFGRTLIDDDYVYTEVARGTTGDGDRTAGQVVFSNLPLGTYYLDELGTRTITSPSSWTEEYYPIELTSDGQVFTLDVGNYIPPDPDPVASIVIEKYNDASGDGVLQDGEEPLDGIEFVLFERSSIDGDYFYYEVARGTTGDGDWTAGQVVFSNLPLGTYYLDELGTRTITSPSSWTEQYYPIQLTSDGQLFTLDVGNFLPNPLLSLTKIGIFNSGNDEFADPGEFITYEFEIKNMGNVTLTGVTLNDPMLGGSITLPSSTLQVGETLTGTASYAVTQADIDAGKVENTATADSIESDHYTDDETVSLPQNPSLTLEKTGTFNSGNDEFADPGELITYVFEIKNTGNVTLTGITLDDPMLGGLIALPSSTLEVGETLTGTATYAVTQADIDAGRVLNTATADSVESSPDTDNETVNLPQNPVLELIKSGTWVDADKDGKADPGEMVNFSFTVTNKGNVTLTNVMVSELVEGITVIGGPISLDVNESDATTFTASYTLKQSDIEKGNVYNHASADSSQTEPVYDDVTVPLVKRAALSIIKNGTWVDSNNDGFANIGEKINYTFTVSNTGNVKLTNVHVTDPKVTVSGNPVVLEVGDDPVVFTGVYTLTQADLNVKAVYNIATAHSNESANDTDDHNINLRVYTPPTTNRTPDPDPDPGNIEIFKFLDVDESKSFNDGDLPFSNILFQLFDNEKDLIDTASTDDEGIITFRNLDPGTYYIKEARQDYTITTAGFDDDGYHMIVLDEDEDYSIDVGNYREVIPPQEPPLGPPPIIEEVIEDRVPQGPPLPKTGELPPYFAYGFGSLLVLAGLFMKRKY